MCFASFLGMNFLSHISMLLTRCRDFIKSQPLKKLRVMGLGSSRERERERER